jgi:hypothetical protein
MTKISRTIDQQPVALLGLDWQWENGDKFALVEAVALCTANGWEYPDWVRDKIGEAMTNLYQAVYPELELDVTNPKERSISILKFEEREIAKRLKQELAQSLDLLGLKIEKTNAIKRRRITIRDLHLANLVAEKCRFVERPRPGFRGINKAVSNLAAILQDDQQSKEERYPPECWGADEHVIMRAWKKHRASLTELYLSFPNN